MGGSVKAILCTMGLAAVLATGAGAQQATRTQPVEGMRDNGTGFHALVGRGW